MMHPIFRRWKQFGDKFMNYEPAKLLDSLTNDKFDIAWQCGQI